MVGSTHRHAWRPEVLKQLLNAAASASTGGALIAILANRIHKGSVRRQTIDRLLRYLAQCFECLTCVIRLRVRPLQAAQANAGRSAVAGGNFENLSQYLPPRTLGINFGLWF